MGWGVGWGVDSALRVKAQNWQKHSQRSRNSKANNLSARPTLCVRLSYSIWSCTVRWRCKNIGTWPWQIASTGTIANRTYFQNKVTLRPHPKSHPFSDRWSQFGWCTSLQKQVSLTRKPRQWPKSSELSNSVQDEDSWWEMW